MSRRWRIMVHGNGRAVGLYAKALSLVSAGGILDLGVRLCLITLGADGAWFDDGPLLGQRFRLRRRSGRLRPGAATPFWRRLLGPRLVPSEPTHAGGAQDGKPRAPPAGGGGQRVAGRRAQRDTQEYRRRDSSGLRAPAPQGHRRVAGRRKLAIPIYSRRSVNHAGRQPLAHSDPLRRERIRSWSQCTHAAVHGWCTRVPAKLRQFTMAAVDRLDEFSSTHIRACLRAQAVVPH